MPKPLRFHDESLNTLGFWMTTSGANLEEIRKNPVLLYNHNDYARPVGRLENIRVENGGLVGDPVFDLLDTRENGGAALASQYERDFIRMGSVGAWPPEEISTDPLLMKPGQTRPTVTKWTVREVSICSIGANHNALAFFDRKTGEQIELKDDHSLIKLMDNATKTSQIDIKMDELNAILKLSDTATLAEKATAVKNLVSERDRLKSENVTLADTVSKMNEAAKASKKAEAIALTDAAIKDGRIEAKSKDNYIKLFDLDFETTKASLEALPRRKSVTEQIESAAGAESVELADLQKKSWEELDRSGKLTLLRDKYFDTYAQKFESKFGVQPKKD